LFPVVGLFLVVVVGIGAIALQQASSLFHERSAQALDLDVHTAGGHIDSWFADRLLDLQSWSSLAFVSSALSDPGARPSASVQLASIAKTFSFCQSLNLLDPSGTAVASSEPSRLGKSFADRDYFKKAIAGQANISEPIVSKITGKPTVTVAAPVLGGSGKPIGVLYFAIGLDRFSSQFLSSFSTDSFSYAFVFQISNGKVVAHPDTSLILKAKLDSLPLGPLVLRAMKDETVSERVLGRFAQVEYSPIPSTGWGLVVVHDQEKENARLASARWLLVGLSLLAAVLAALVVVFWIVRPMVGSLKDALDFALAVGEGDVSRTLEAKTDDEIGDLVRTLSSMGESLKLKADAVGRVGDRDLTVEIHPLTPKDVLGKALERMVKNLRQVLGQAGKSANETVAAADVFQRLSGNLASAAEETSSQSNLVSTSSEQVHRNVQAVAAGTEEMGASIREIARSASDAAHIAAEAVERVNRTNALVEKLGAASAEIGSVVEVIRGIADQTNLLALNATIEAARAGEAGKGFAVVAGEVKELSKATREATEGISTRIETIQGEMTTAVSSIRDIGQVIQKVNDISQSIASAVEEQTAATSEISRSIAEASRGMGEITEGVLQVSVAANTTSRSAAEIQTDSDKLKRQAEELSASVGAFRLS
jgi:methyl-accepting chemotaxis protein